LAAEQNAQVSERLGDIDQRPIASCARPIDSKWMADIGIAGAPVIRYFELVNI
jgi:hypothetical protein